jgi:hypothetical protein
VSLLLHPACLRSSPRQARYSSVPAALNPLASVRPQEPQERPDPRGAREQLRGARRQLPRDGAAPVPGADAAGVSPVPGADAAGVSPSPRPMWGWISVQIYEASLSDFLNLSLIKNCPTVRTPIPFHDPCLKCKGSRDQNSRRRVRFWARFRAPSLSRCAGMLVHAIAAQRRTPPARLRRPPPARLRRRCANSSCPTARRSSCC